MRRLEDMERSVFREIGTNSFLEFEEGEFVLVQPEMEKPRFPLV